MDAVTERELVGYEWEGAVFCLYCQPYPEDEEAGDGEPVYADMVYDPRYGEVGCEQCQAWVLRLPTQPPTPPHEAHGAAGQGDERE